MSSVLAYAGAFLGVFSIILACAYCAQREPSIRRPRSLVGCAVLDIVSRTANNHDFVLRRVGIVKRVTAFWAVCETVDVTEGQHGYRCEFEVPIGGLHQSRQQPKTFFNYTHTTP